MKVTAGLTNDRGSEGEGKVNDGGINSVDPPVLLRYSSP